MDFGEIRSMLEGLRDPFAWVALTDALETLRAEDPERFDEEVLPHVKGALEDWDDALKVCPSRWVPRALDPDCDDALLSITRVLPIGFREAVRPPTGCSPHISQVHTFRVVTNFHHDVDDVLAVIARHTAYHTLELMHCGDDIAGWGASWYRERTERLIFHEQAFHLESFVTQGFERLRSIEILDDGLNSLDMFDDRWLMKLERCILPLRDDALRHKLLHRLAQSPHLRALALNTSDRDVLQHMDKAWDLREVVLQDWSDASTLSLLQSDPCFANVENLTILYPLPGDEAPHALLQAQRAGELPTLRRVGWLRNANEESSEGCWNAPILEQLHTSLPAHFEQCAYAALPGQALQPLHLTLGARDLGWDPFEYEYSEKSRAPMEERALLEMDALLERLETQRPRSLCFFSPTPAITRRLLDWAGLRHLDQLVLLCDALCLPDEEYPRYAFGAQDMEHLQASSALASIPRLHLRIYPHETSSWPCGALPGLVTLDLSRTALDNATMAALGEQGLLSSVQRLHVRDNPDLHPGVVLQALAGSTMVRWVDASYTSEEDGEEVEYELRSAAALPRLAHVDLTDMADRRLFGEDCDRLYGDTALSSIITNWHHYEDPD